MQHLVMCFTLACQTVRRAQHFILLQGCRRLSRSRLSSSSRRSCRGCRQSISGKQAAPGTLVAAPMGLSCCPAMCQQELVLLPLQRLHWVCSLQAVLLGSRVGQSHLCLLLLSLLASKRATGPSRGARPLARRLTPCSTLRCRLRLLCRQQRGEGNLPGGLAAVAAAAVAATSSSASTCAAASVGALLLARLQLGPPPAVALQRDFMHAACLLAASTRALMPRVVHLWLHQPPAARTLGRWMQAACQFSTFLPGQTDLHLAWLWPWSSLLGASTRLQLTGAAQGSTC